MTEQKDRYADWIGATQTVEDEISLSPVIGMCATLDDKDSVFKQGDALPPLWQWLYFLPRAPLSAIGPDGHPKKGGFLPPVELPRRMFAGARIRFLKSLVIGRPAVRVGEVKHISEKEGKSGRLAFVTVEYRILQDGEPCIEEEQDIVYREPGGRISAPVPTDHLPTVPTNAWTRTITPDPVLLFRFSALTFNAHRIHYDRRYAMEEEGYPGLVVHGPLLAVQLMELVRHNASRTVANFSFRGRAPVFDLAPYRVVGVPSQEESANIVELEAQGPDGAVAMTASAELVTGD